MTAPYYQDESVTLYLGDCREVMEWLSADVLVTDPPYGIGYTNWRGETVLNDHDFRAAEDAMRAAGSMPGGMAVFASHASLPRTLEAVRSRHERTRVAVWHKTNVNGAGMGMRWMADVEFVVCGVPEWPAGWASALISARKFTGNPDYASPRSDAYLHPTQKPVGVMSAVLQIMSQGVVADPFAGSGSTLVAAKAQGRRAIGVEIEERYCEVIAKRLSQGVLDFGEPA